MSVILVLRGPRQQNHKPSLGYVTRPALEKQQRQLANMQIYIDILVLETRWHHLATQETVSYVLQVQR